MTIVELTSQLDASVNFIENFGDNQALEARFVRRVSDYIVVYVSAQTGCAQACRFCHLTATGQVKYKDARVEEITAQAARVLDWFDNSEQAADKPRKVHFNFMARGEPLNSAVMCESGDEINNALAAMASARGLVSAVKISTIMPTSLTQSLSEIFPVTSPDIYYSLYSTNEVFRKKWLPKAAPLDASLDALAQWSNDKKKIPVIHHALIQTDDGGGNWEVEEALRIVDKVNAAGLRVDVNLVRYNPPSPKHGFEPSEDIINAHADVYRNAWGAANVQVVKRVGYDVAASCGMFVGGRAPRG